MTCQALSQPARRLLLITLALLTLSNTCLAVELQPGSNRIHSQTIERSAADLLPYLPEGRLKERPQSVTIYQIDDGPLKNRQPILFVHGLRAEYRKWFRWGKVIRRFRDYPDFARQYKVFLVHYDSTESLSRTVPQFKEAFLSFHETVGKQPVTVMALSLGGNLVCQAMLDKQIDRAIRIVFAFGTPFHGSPIFCPDWFQWSLYRNFYLPWTRIDRSLTYRLYFARNPNLIEDLKWDNCDGNLPEEGRFRSLLPLGPRGNLKAESNTNHALAKINNNPALPRRKFILYAGYIPNPYLRSPFSRHLELSLLYPYSFVMTKIPAHLARERPVLKMLNRDITRVIPGDSVRSLSAFPYIYGLNDGITPVASALMLPNHVCRDNPAASEKDLGKLSNLCDVKLARVFKGADHLVFIEGYLPPRGHRLLIDRLHPEHGARTVFDWMLSDLMRLDMEEEKLARGSATLPANPAGVGSTSQEVRRQIPELD